MLAADPLRRRSARWAGFEATLLVTLTVIAALPRLLEPDLVPFGYDEALEALRARAIALGARPVANEVTSWLIPDPALMLYVYALVEAAADPPILRTWLLGALNIASVILAYFWGRLVGGPTLALLTGGLYAASPWAIYFGRQPWVNAQPVLSSVMLVCATQVVMGRDRRWSLPFFIALGLQMQTHLLGTVLALPAALTVLAFWRAWGRWLIPGFLLVAAANLPFAIHVWEHRESVGQTLVGGTPQVVVNQPADAPRLLAWFVGGTELEQKLVEGATELTLLTPFRTLAGVALVSALVAGVGVATVRIAQRAPGWQGLLVALIWLLAPLAASMAQSRPVYIHYMTALAPACFLLAALPVSLLCQASRLGAAVGACLTVSILSIHLLSFWGMLRGIEVEAALPPQAETADERQARLNVLERQTRMTGVGDLVGPTLRTWSGLTRNVRTISHERSEPVITIPLGLNEPYTLYVDRRRMALDYLLGTGIQARFPFEGTVVLPLEKPGLLLLLPGVDPGRAYRNPELLLAVPHPGTSDLTRLVSIPPRPLRDQGLGRRSIQAQFEIGAQLLAFDLPGRVEPGEPVALTTYWTFAGLKPDAATREISAFFHLVDAAGGIVAQSDGLGLPSSAWRSGDLLVRRTTLASPADQGETRLSAVVGLYEQGSLRRLPVALSEGRADDRVVLSSVTIR